jgi:integrase
MAIKVHLRTKEISKGRLSLYLDFYPAIENPKTGNLTRREFLNMYLYNDKAEVKKQIKEKKANGKSIDKVEMLYKELAPLNPAQKVHNKETQSIAESIQQKRQNFLDKPEIYSEYEKQQLEIKEKGALCFVKYFKTLANKREKSNHGNWVSALKYLEDYTGGTLKFEHLTEKKLNDFKDYLLTTKSNKSDKVLLANNSAVSYFNKLKAAVKQSFQDGIISYDLNARIKPIKAVETRRQVLTIQELNKLVNTNCNNPLLKRAAFFSVLTGLRFVDISKMKWSELEYISDKGYVLNFDQQKTKGVEVLPISVQAYSLTNGADNPNEMPQDQKVFNELKYSAYQNKHLYQWIGAAGITKEITFHCFRHTYATLQLHNGTDIYTVSKMLGHKDLKTTQIYAKIVDEAKREATNKIKLDL